MIVFGGMEWAKEVRAAMKSGIARCEPSPSYTLDDVVTIILDEIATRAVFRANADPKVLKTTFNAPFIPMGSVVPSVLIERYICIEVVIGGQEWQEALQTVNQYVYENADAICKAFAGKGRPWEEDYTE